MDGPRIRIGQAEVLLYPVMGFENLVVPALVIDSSGQVAACGTGGETVEFLAVNGFRVEAQACTFLADGLYLSGKVYFPGALGEEAHAAYDNLEVRLESDGAVITPQTDGPVTYRLAGLDVAAEGFRFDREGLSIRYNTLDLFGSGLEFIVPDVQFYPDGTFKVAGRSFEPFSFRPLGGPIEVGITRLDLNDDGVHLSAFVGLPPAFCAEAIYFDRLTLHPDGRITSDAAVPEFAFELGGIHFTFRNIRFDETGFVIGEALLDLPGGALEGVSLRVINLRIRNDGSFELGGLSFDPFELWGYTFDIENIGFARRGGLPGRRDPPALRFFIEQLAGKRIGIERFQISLEGEVRDFLVRIEEPLSFLLFNTWALSVEDIAISRELLTVERGRLALPPGLGVDSAAVSDLVINVRTGAIDVGGITIAGFTIGYGGLAFEVDTLTISSARGLEFCGSVALPPVLPSGLAGRRLEVDMFQVRPDGSVGDISASLGGIDTALLDGLFVLEDGTFGLHKSGDELRVSCSGTLLLDTRFPQGIGGKRVDIRAFEVDVEDGTILALDARAQDLSLDLFGFSRVEADELAVALNPDTRQVELSVAGDILLQAGFPASLQGERVAIERFTIDQTGAIREFAARLPLPGERPLIGSLTLADAEMKAELSPAGGALVFDVGGAILFGAGFPQGIAGTQVDIDALRFDDRGNLLELDVAADFQEPLTLLGSVTVTGGRVALGKYGDKDILVSVGGTVKLPAGFPQGLAGLPVAIRTFSISSSGQIVEVDIQADGIHTGIWGQLSLVDGSLRVSNDGDELLFTFGGDLLLPASLPNQLAGLRLRIEELVLSSEQGLVSFSAGNVTSIEAELFAGVRMVFDTIMVSDRGLRLAGKLRFPDTFPQGLAGLVINLDNLEMDWDGTVRDIQAGVDQAVIKLAGFTTRIEDLLFTADGISVASCILTLPPSLDSKQVGVVDAGFDRGGHFYGDVLLPRLEVDAAGFTVVLEDPELDPEHSEIRFGRVGMVLPDFIASAQVDLYGVAIGPEGLRLTGGAIRLPDFCIAGGLGFKEVRVTLVLDDAKYMVEGTGKMLVPGAGTFGALLSFTNKSSTYPWGMKQAFFSWEAFGLGLPLGATGMFINGIRGGLAFGPPDEIPQKVRGLFDEGTRLQLGLSMQDASGGNVIESDADVWVDITDFDWAFEGDVTVLRGLVKGEIVAALTGRGFYGDFMVRLVFVEGRVTVYVYQYHGDTEVSGSGEVKFGLRAGTIVNKRIRLWPFRKYIHIRIPARDWWLASLGAEFGRFKNGAVGFKGQIKVPIWGRVGVFVPRGGGIKFGNVSKYELYDPFETRSLMRGLAAASLPGEGRVTALDDYGSAGTRDVYGFRVPGGPGGEEGPGAGCAPWPRRSRLRSRRRRWSGSCSPWPSRRATRW